MIVFDLKCSQQHIFEGWFGSTADFENQVERGLLCCPICGVSEVAKAVMAPLVGSKSNQQVDTQPREAQHTQTSTDPARDVASKPDQHEAATGVSNDEIKQALLKLAKVQEKALESSKWVGKDFAETARAMHYGEQDDKPVHGEVSPEDAKGLLDEGIEIAPLPLPVRRPDEEH